MKIVLLLLCIVYFVHSSTVIRTNSFGFLPQSQKTAVVLSSTLLSNVRFSVYSGNNAVYSSSSVTSSAKWNTQYAYTYQLDFTTVQTIGNYTIQLYDAQGNVIASSPFTISSSVAYNQLIENSLFYYRAQRDGSNIDPTVLQRKASHLTDQSAFVYATPQYSNEQLIGPLMRTGGPVDVSGGYFDAGDYLKFVQTTSFVVDLMGVALRDYAPNNTNLKNEFLHGINWLLKMWDDSNGILYYQVGIGDGNSQTLADHDVWRLPEADDKLNPTSPSSSNYFIKYRPVFSTSNSISPNLAGRMAGAFALCSQLFKGSNDTLATQCLNSAKHIYSLAKTSGVTTLTTTAPFDYYPEAEWRDDMEFGAIQLYKATFAINYLQDAANYANAYINNANEKGILNLYDIAGLAHYELHKIISAGVTGTTLAVTKDKLLSDRKQLLDAAQRASNTDPFHFGDAYNSGNDLVPLAFGLWLESSFYNELTQSTTYQSLATQQSNWVFGQNAWGTAFVVGAGTVFPHCLQHQVANLVGGLNGTGNVLLGAVVDGPSQTDNFSGLGVPDGAKRCNWNVFSGYDGKGVKYIDNVTSWPSSEPANDYTVMSLLAFARTAKVGI